MNPTRTSVELLTDEEAIKDELTKIPFNYPQRIDYKTPVEIYNDKPYNTILQKINEYGEQYIFRASFFNIVNVQPMNDKQNLEKLFRKAATIWWHLLSTGKFAIMGSLGGIVCLPMALYDKKNQIWVTESLLPSLIPYPSGDKAFDVKSEDVERKFVFMITLYPYNRKDTVVTSEWLNEQTLPGFVKEGEIGSYSFDDFENRLGGKVTQVS